MLPTHLSGTTSPSSVSVLPIIQIVEHGNVLVTFWVTALGSTIQVLLLVLVAGQPVVEGSLQEAHMDHTFCTAKSPIYSYVAT